jgi:hypothetical protein
VHKTTSLLTSTIALVLACTPQGAGHRERAESQIITEDEVEASRTATAYEVIQKLRPNFLSYRGETGFDKTTSQPFPMVYVDGQEFGQIASLRNIPASQVSTIRLYRSWEAATQFGTGNMAGVIAITTRR